MKISRLNNVFTSRFIHYRAQSGFTLIEMLVVLIIIGVVVSSVTLSIKTDDRGEEMHTTMRRIEALIKLARDEAVLQNENIALTVQEHNYSFEVLGDKGWEPISDENIFRERKVLDGTELALKVDDLEVKFGKQQKDAGDDKVTPPRIYILASGEIMPFELILRTEDRALEYRLKADPDGTLTLISPNDS